MSEVKPSSEVEEKKAPEPTQALVPTFYMVVMYDDFEESRTEGMIGHFATLDEAKKWADEWPERWSRESDWCIFTVQLGASPEAIEYPDGKAFPSIDSSFRKVHRDVVYAVWERHVEVWVNYMARQSDEDSMEIGLAEFLKCPVQVRYKDGFNRIRITPYVAADLDTLAKIAIDRLREKHVRR